MRLGQAAEPVFARHETFHPRWGWFTKAVRGAAQNPVVFTAEDATVRLGVGKNMVRAIRFWGLASRLLTQAHNPDQPRRPLAVVSRIGEAVMGGDGWDPYLEDPATLWLIHWLLLAPRSQVPVWWVAFGEFRAVEFTEAGLLEFVTEEVNAVPDWRSPKNSSLRKDVSCLFRMYAPRAETPGRESIDDLLDCPFRELGLVQAAGPGDESRYRFVIGAKPTLPAAVIGYAVFDFLARTDAAARTATIGRLATEPGSPGRAFKLTEGVLSTALGAVGESTDGVAVTSVAGSEQLTYSRNPAAIAADIIAAYYGTDVPPTSVAGPAADLPCDEAFRPHASKGKKPPPLDGPPPEDPLLRVEWQQRRIDAGLRSRR